MTLERAQQLQGQRCLLGLYRTNSLGANLLIGQVVYLLALDLGAGDVAMGLLYGGVWIAGMFAFAAPALCAKHDPARLAAASWMLRSLLCTGYLAVPLLPASWGVGLVVSVFLTFMIFRTVGVAALNAAMTRYTGPGELTPLVALSHLWWHLGTLAITILATVVLGWWPGHEAYYGLIALGIVLSVLSAASLRTLPAVGIEQGESLLTSLPPIVADRGVRMTLAATLLVVPQAVAAAYQLNVLNGPLALSASTITGLSLAGMVLSIGAIRLLGLLLPRTGLRPVQLATHLLLAAIGLAWTFAGLVPLSWRTGWCIGLFILAQALLATSTAILAALHVDRLPERSPVAASALYQAAGAAAGLLGIGLVWLMGHTGLERLPGTGPYAHAFIVWAACSAGVCLLSLATGGTAQVLADLRLLHPANLLGWIWDRREQERPAAPDHRIPPDACTPPSQSLTSISHLNKKS